MPLPPRNVELCLIVLEELDQKEIKEAAGQYQEQTYHNWKLLLFSKGPIP